MIDTVDSALGAGVGVLLAMLADVAIDTGAVLYAALGVLGWIVVRIELISRRVDRAAARSDDNGRAIAALVRRFNAREDASA